MTREELEAALYSYYNQWDLQDAIRQLQGKNNTQDSLLKALRVRIEKVKGEK